MRQRQADLWVQGQDSQGYKEKPFWKQKNKKQKGTLNLKGQGSSHSVSLAVLDCLAEHCLNHATTWGFLTGQIFLQWKLIFVVNFFIGSWISSPVFYSQSFCFCLSNYRQKFSHSSSLQLWVITQAEHCNAGCLIPTFSSLPDSSVYPWPCPL